MVPTSKGVELYSIACNWHTMHRYANIAYTTDIRTYVYVTLYTATFWRTIQCKSFYVIGIHAHCLVHTNICGST